MRLIALATLVVAVAACSRRAPAPVNAPIGLEPAEAAVFRAVADSVYLRTVDQRVAVIARTVDTVCAAPNGPCAPAGARFGLEPLWWADGDTATAMHMREDLLRRSAMPIHLDAALAESERLPSTSAHEIGAMLTTPDGWPAFRARYGGAVGYLRFSRVGFSPDRQRAVVYVEWECGPTCGHHMAVSLRRVEEGPWSIHDMLLLSSRRGGGVPSAQ